MEIFLAAIIILGFFLLLLSVKGESIYSGSSKNFDSSEIANLNKGIINSETYREELELHPEYREKFIEWLRAYCMFSNEIPEDYQLAVKTGNPFDLPEKSRNAFLAWDQFQSISMGEYLRAMWGKRKTRDIPNSSFKTVDRDNIYTGPRGGKYRVTNKGRKSYDVK